LFFCSNPAIIRITKQPSLPKLNTGKASSLIGTLVQESLFRRYWNIAVLWVITRIGLSYWCIELYVRNLSQEGCTTKKLPNGSFDIRRRLPRSSLRVKNDLSNVHMKMRQNVLERNKFWSSRNEKKIERQYISSLLRCNLILRFCFIFVDI